MKSKSLIWFVAGILLMLVLVQGVQAAEAYGYVTQWGSLGYYDGEFTNPSGICAHPFAPSYVYVVDSGNNRVEKFTTDSVYYSQFGSFGSGNGQLINPYGCAVDSLGNTYVVDVGNYRIQRFSAEGGFYNKWGSWGSGDGQFLDPRGIAEQSPAHNNYVADSGNNRVQKFNINGDYLTQWGTYGSGDGEFNHPFGIAVDPNSYDVYVADTGNNRIQKFTPAGIYLTKWGSSGSGNGEFTSPEAIAVDGAGNVYVADTGNNRIQKFTSTGTYLTKWGSSGSGNGEFTSPEGIAVDGAGNVYVTDTGNNRIQKFALIPITITAAGDQDYYLGETVEFSGTNTETGTTYLFVIGPNLPAQGAKLNDDPYNSGVIDGNAASFTQAAVTGGTWSFNWPLSESNMDAGTYTIHAVTQPRDKNNLPFGYSTVSIILKKPFIAADYTADKTSCTAPCTVSFTDVSTGVPDPVSGWAWYFGDEKYTESWTQQPTGTPWWSERADHSSVVLPDGSIVLMGGWKENTPTSFFNDVWRSTDKGATWTQLPDAAWSVRWGHSSVVLPDGSILLMGGAEGTTGKNDVWRSTDKGATWTEMTPPGGAGWAGRYEHSSVVLPDESIVLTGGIDEGSTFMNDVWRSTDKGATWTEMTPPMGAEWSTRHGHNTVAMVDGNIVLMGGYDGTYSYNDVWQSTDKGATWTQLPDAGWTPRLDFSSVVMPDDSIVLTGSAVQDNEVWRSTDMGATWTQLPYAAWSEREAHSSVAMPDGSIVLMGGVSGHAIGDFKNDVWRLNPVGSSVQNPSHIYTTPGIYQVALQAFDATGYSSVRKPNYITVTSGGPGDIRVESDPPGADVYIDDNPMALPTNDTFTGFTPGIHTVKITKTNYFDAKRDVTVVSGDTVKTVIKLDSTSALPPQLVGPVNAVLKKKLDYDTTGVEVIANTQIQNAPTVQLYWDQPQHSFTTANCALTAIDEGPDANGVRDESRPITYMCVDTTDNTIIEEWVAYAPSTNYGFVHAVGESQDVGEAWIPDDPDAWEPTCQENCNNYYALLISGGTDKNKNYRRYWNDIAFMYVTLVEYGYTADHIKVLMSDGPDTVADRCIATSGTTCTQWDSSPQNLDGIGENEVITAATKANVLTELRRQRTGLTNSNNLFIFTTGHGSGDSSKNSVLKLWNNEQITDDEFFNALYGINGETADPNKIPNITMVMEQCNGGGFNDEITASGPANWVLETAANYNEASYGNGFSNAWTVGVAGHNRYNPTTYDRSADSGDRRVTTLEAYNYAKAKDPYAVSETEHPQKYILGAERYMNDCTGTATKAIRVTYPKLVGIRWMQGSVNEITWEVDGITGSVNIYLVQGTTPETVTPLGTNVPANQGWYYGTVPATQPVGTNYKIRVKSSDGLTIGNSQNNFEIYLKSATTADNLGGLTFTTIPAGAKLYLDVSTTALTGDGGQTVTPFTKTGLVAGDHRVKVTMSGYYDQSYKVTVVAKQINPVSPWRLDKIDTDVNNEPLDWDPWGGMKITSDPDGAEIWIDDDLTDSNPAVYRGKAIGEAVLNLAPGDYSVYGTKAGYKPSEPQLVTVESFSLLRDPVPVHLVLTVREPDWYTFAGFYAPVDMNGVINVANGGRTIPVKWRLSDKNGYVSNAENFDIQIKPVACLAGSPDPIEVYEPGTSSSLIYNGNGNWHYNWKTVKSYAPNCMNLNIKFANGQESPVAKFRFK